MTPRLQQLLLVLVVGLAGAEFVVRGPMRFVEHGESRRTDLAGPYLGARALLQGLNPYSSAVFWDMADQVGWGEGRNDREDDFESRSPYPVTTFVLMAPLASMSWPVARVATSLLCSALVVLAIGLLASLPGFGGPAAQPRRLLFVALALGLAPLHSALGTGNLVAASVALTVIGAWALLGERAYLAGVCLALAACVKPPIAAPLLGLVLLRGRWRALGTATLVMTAVVAVAAIRLAGTPWVAGYIANNSLLLSNSGVDIIKWSPAQLQFINLQYLGYFLFSSPRVVSMVSMLVGGLLCVAWFVLLMRRPGGAPSPIELSVAVVISLLPIYHRVYDAALLLLPLAWALANPWRDSRVPRALTLLLVVPFLVPGATWLELQTSAGRVPTALLSQWWWSAVVVPHQVWALLVLSLVLLGAQATAERAA